VHIPKRFSEDDVTLNRIEFTQFRDDAAYNGEWIGLLKCSAAGSEHMRNALLELSEMENFNSLKMPDLLNYIIAKGVDVNVLYIDGNWLDVDNFQDLKRVMEFNQ